MWFEILPAFSIIVGALALPAFALPGIHKLFLDNPNRRNFDERFDRVMYLRDFRLTGNPYKMSGLEAIPDESEDGGNDKKKAISKRPPQNTSQVADKEGNKKEVKELENVVKEDDTIKTTLKGQDQKLNVEESKQNKEGEKAVDPEENIKNKEHIKKKI